VDRNARIAWNELVAAVPDWPSVSIDVPSYGEQYSLPYEAFPDCLWSDLDAYLDSRRDKGERAIDDLLADPDLLNGSADLDVHRPIRGTTANLIRYRVRQFASALVTDRKLEAAEITSLSVLVQPTVVRDGLSFFVRRAGRLDTSQIHGIATDLHMIAKLWVKSSVSDLDRLGAIRKKVRRRQRGLAGSARRSLAPFKDAANVRAFLNLPDRIVADVERNKVPGPADANRVAAALWMKITQRAPLRISNLLATDLHANVLRSHNGAGASVALFFPGEMVKNAKPLEVPLPTPTVKLLDLYLAKYRKLLVGSTNPFLFPAPAGKPQRSNVVSRRVQELMHEYLGFAVNPHSFRHVAAWLYLAAHPGRYADVQLLLGHKKLETTMSYYCELEAEEVFRHFDSILLGLEDGRQADGR
jgi:integrase